MHRLVYHRLDLFDADGLPVPDHESRQEWQSLHPQCLPDPEDAETHEVSQPHASAEGLTTHAIRQPVAGGQFNESIFRNIFE